MDPFSAAFLTTLAGKLAGNVAASLTGPLKRQIAGTPAQQAVERSLRVALVALAAQATAAAPEQETLLRDIFDEFFHYPAVWVQIGRLLKDKPLDRDELGELFAEAGYDAAKLPNLDFNAALDAFQAAFVEVADGEKELQGIIQIGQLRRQTGIQGELLAKVSELVAAVREQTAVTVRNGQLLAQGQARPIYEWQVGKVVGRDEIHDAGNVLSGDFRQATIHIVNHYLNASGEHLWSEDSFREALRRYLDWVTKRYGSPQLRGVEKKERELPSITLEKVYVSLGAVPDPERQEEEPARQGRRRTPGQPELPGEGRPEPVDMATLLRDNPRLVITGAPGCGKTTFLYVIASMLARGLLTGRTEEAQKLLGLPLPLPLPVYISLGDYNRYRLGPQAAADPEHGTLLAYARYALIRQLGGLRLPRDFFERLLTQGQACVFLLDGLDEVVDERHRQIVSGDVENLSYIDDIGRMVVTSRTRAYVGESKLPPTFRRAEVQPMTPEQVNELAGRWCRAVYDPVDAPDETAQLQAEIARLEAHRRARGEERRLADTPLLVTIIAIVHYNDKHLPEQRAALYKSCVHVLLAETHHTKGEARHDLEDWGGSEEDKRELLTLLAFNMMSAGEKAGRTVQEATLKSWLRPRLVRRKGEEGADAALREFVQAMAERASLLNERDRVYEFIHLSFQEYLCATYLAHELPDATAIVNFLGHQGRLSDSWWRETILLTPGHLSTDNRAAALNLIERLGGSAGRDVSALAAAELAASAYLELNFTDQPACDALAGRLAALLTDEKLTFPNPLRGLAGLALGRLGDPRPDVTCDAPVTVEIPAGKFIMGSERREGQPGCDELSKWEDEATPQGTRFEVALPAYRIGKYPVTVAQFRRFVDAEGYDPEQSGGYWQGGGFEWLRKSGQRAPVYWDDPMWNVDNHPVVGVTWYEAVAYCAWLTASSPGRFFRLPDEAMWEKAARGTDGRRWPWGNDWDAAKLNAEGSIGRTSAVGIFPTGSRKVNDKGERIYDCAGNVWEWCSGPGYRSGANYPLKLATYDEKSYIQEVASSVDTRALRGGSWDYYDQITRAAFRNDYNPLNRGNDVGFRVAELLSDPAS